MIGGDLAPLSHGILSHLSATHGSLRAPLCVSLEVTTECNQQCLFCCQSLPRRKAERATHRLSAATCEGLCRRFAELAVVSVSLTGGEPACHPEFRAIVDGVKRRNLSLTIETNGTRLTEADIRWLGTILEPERDAVCLSLDAASETTYRALRGSPRFDSVKAALDDFRRYRIPFMANTVVVRANLGEIEAIHALASRHGAAHHRFGFPHRYPQAPAEVFLSPDEEAGALARLQSMGIGTATCGKPGPLESMAPGRVVLDRSMSVGSGPRSLPCPAGLISCAIDARGRVAMCRFDLDAGASQRSVHERDFQDLWLEITRMRGALELRDGEIRPACPRKAFLRHPVHLEDVR